MAAAGIICRRGPAMLSSQWRFRFAFAATSATGGRRGIKSLIPDELVPAADASPDTPSDASASSPPPASEAIYSSSKLGEVLKLSQLVNPKDKRAVAIDTLAIMMRLEALGLPRLQAEGITLLMTEVANNSLENVAQGFATKGQMQLQTIKMIQDVKFSEFKSEVQQSQEHHFSLLRRETEMLRVDYERMRSEIRYQIGKVTADFRLQLNLERGHNREDLAKQSAKTNDLTMKLDREIHARKAHLEATKCKVMKYVVGTLVSVSAVGLAAVQILI